MYRWTLVYCTADPAGMAEKAEPQGMIETSISMGPYSSRSCRAAQFIALLVAALSIHACGGDSPGSPSGNLSAPSLASPQDDAVTAGRPALTINNATGGSGARTYDFQVALTEAALSGPADGLFTSASGVAEGSGGRTSFQMNRDLQANRRYFWRARALQGTTAGPWSGTFRFRSEAGVNAPPVIQAINVNSRAEAGSEIEVNASVTDQEATTATLVFEWSATGGTFSGSGATVRWTAPPGTAPAAFDLNLTVIERYPVALPGGGEETRENRTSGRATVRVNDSSREIAALATTFIDDFLHSERTPEFCVRNFSDSCPGKAEELNDIRQNRARFVNNPSASTMGPSSITFFDVSSSTRRVQVPASLATYAELTASCRFAATDRSTGQSSVAVGTCLLTSVYENFQWRLCDSRFLAPSLSPETRAQASTISGALARFAR